MSLPKKPKTTQRGAPFYPRGMTVSSVHFAVHPGLAEVQQIARSNGWSSVSAEADEVVFTTDGWKTSRVMRASDTPPPMSPDGRIFLPEVQRGTEVEFALKVGVHPAGADPQAARAVVWLNNGGKNYRQVTG
ncbi:MAG TPA: hypothetical protein VND93_08620 [Myxococcales bacterium]|nr:hypothetical protein [Myxococcales bacterium]